MQIIAQMRSISFKFDFHFRACSLSSNRGSRTVRVHSSKEQVADTDTTVSEHLEPENEIAEKLKSGNGVPVLIELEEGPGKKRLLSDTATALAFNDVTPSSKSSGSFKCKQCGHVCNTSEGLNIHKRKHSGNNCFLKPL